MQRVLWKFAFKWAEAAAVGIKSNGSDPFMAVGYFYGNEFNKPLGIISEWAIPETGRALFERVAKAAGQRKLDASIKKVNL